MPSEASSKPRDDVQRITGILRKLTRDFGSMPPTARRQLMKRVDVYLDELIRLR